MNRTLMNINWVGANSDFLCYVSNQRVKYVSDHVFWYWIAHLQILIGGNSDFLCYVSIQTEPAFRYLIPHVFKFWTILFSLLLLLMVFSDKGNFLPKQNIKERFYITAHGLKPVFSLVTVPHGYMQIHHVWAPWLVYLLKWPPNAGEIWIRWKWKWFCQAAKRRRSGQQKRWN